MPRRLSALASPLPSTTTIQVLAAALMGLDMVTRALKARDSQPAIEKVAKARRGLDTALERARTLMFELRPPLLEAHGLAVAITEAADQAATETGFMPVVDVRLGRYPPHTEELIYRTVLEAITNVRKHAHAATLQLCLEESHGAIHGVVEDDGRGFDLDRALDRAHAGLAGRGRSRHTRTDTPVPRA